jgi:hypothetical protein
LWNTKTGVTDFEQEKRSIILGSMSTFTHYHRLKDIQYPPEMDWVSSLLKDVHVIGDTPINQSLQRYPSYLKTINNTRTLKGLADILSSNILTLHALNSHLEEFDEFESICQRVGLANKITVETYSLEGGSKEDSTSYISSVLLDDVNIGLLSDGTLRVLSILLKIIRSSPTSTTIIEEPEIQIHPGMLSKILNEIESYTFGNNLIISTHSPQVVSWAKPHQISLIHRNNSRIFVRRLSSDEINRVIGYLSEDGDLGDWIYSGILDD